MDLTTTSSVLNSIIGHGYLIIFLMMIFEGPLVTYVAAFAASLGYFNIFLIFLISILGNTIPDMIWYAIGRVSGDFVSDKYQRFFKINSSRIQKIKRYLKKNPGKTILIIKITPLLPPIGLMATGAMKVPFQKFLFYSILISVTYSLFFTLLGFYSGAAFNSIAKYVQETSLLFTIAVLILIIGWVILKKISEIVASRIEKI